MTKKILIVGGGPTAPSLVSGDEAARNIILGLQKEDDKPKGITGYVSREIREAKKIERIKAKFGLTHGKGKPKKNKKKRGK